MPTELSPSRNELSVVDGWPQADSRQFSFVVTQDGSPKDISNDEIEWYLLTEPYDNLADAVLSPSNSRVEIRTSAVVDPTAGEFRVDIAEAEDSDLWGEYTQVVVVDPPGDSRQSWRGPVVIDDSG
jgi:hypothetical protein